MSRAKKIAFNEIDDEAPITPEKTILSDETTKEQSEQGHNNIIDSDNEQSSSEAPKKRRNKEDRKRNHKNNGNGSNNIKRLPVKAMKYMSIVASSVGMTYFMQIYVQPIQNQSAQQEEVLNDLKVSTTKNGLQLSELASKLQKSKTETMEIKNNVSDIKGLQNSFEIRIKEYIEKQNKRDKEVAALLDELKIESTENLESIARIKLQIDLIKNDALKDSQKLVEEAKNLRTLIRNISTKRTQESVNQNEKENREISPKKIKAKQVTTINSLKVEGVISYSGHYLAVLTDGLSSAIPVSEGDVLGTMEITEITESTVQYVDKVTGDKYEIEVY